MRALAVDALIFATALVLTQIIMSSVFDYSMGHKWLLGAWTGFILAKII
jgi:hypothetical protein